MTDGEPGSGSVVTGNDVDGDIHGDIDVDTAALESRLARYPAGRYPAQHATAAFHLGTAHLRRGRIPAALDALGIACDIFGQLGMALEQGKTLTMRGVALRESGSGDLARQAFERALRTFADLARPAEEGSASYNLGLVLNDQGNSVAAQQAMAHARQLFLQAGHLAQAGAAAREHGASLLTSGDVRSALALLEEATELAERGDDVPGLGAAANALGLALLAAGDPAGAVDAFSRSAGAFPRSMRPAEHAMAKANLAVAHERAGNQPGARLAARQALSVSNADTPVRTQAQQLLVRLSGSARSDLPMVLDAEPFDRWPAILREEALRWCDLPAPERVEAVSGFVEGLLDRPGTSFDLAESLISVLLELPPQQYAELVTAMVVATGGPPQDHGERVRTVVASALARFPLPQWQRLVGSLNAAAAETGQPAGWR